MILFVVFSVTALSFFTQKENESTNIHEKVVELYVNNTAEGKLRA